MNARKNRVVELSSQALPRVVAVHDEKSDIGRGGIRVTEKDVGKGDEVGTIPQAGSTLARGKLSGTEIKALGASAGPGG
ncbi:hypothetical protein QNO08_08630 [Arthrobacter sp. zg-Y820]|uniref:hypothetical protein n=1 Tax=Arthrobacter sp. zg-Y820 TaxID=2894192 RepID=UPI0024DFD6A5|nr:hypothetical protein [Arthrobacter sp. zg-Y820]WIB07950.1 hypothetical protein QNO08_08630 [Arthrobacter sp. zg-Y820]